MDDLPQIRFSAKDCEGTARIVLTFSQEKRMLRHSLRIYSQTMSNHAVSMYITVEAFFGDSEASSLPGPCNRDLKCDDSVDSTAQSLDAFGAKAKSACKKTRFNMFQLLRLVAAQWVKIVSKCI